MRPRDGNGGVEPHQFREGFSTADDGEPLLACRFEFRVAGLHRSGNDDVLRADQIDRIMTDEDPDALGAKPADVGAFLLIAALNGKALGEQDLSNGAHADAADADDVECASVAGYLHGLFYRPVVARIAEHTRRLAQEPLRP